LVITQLFVAENSALYLGKMAAIKAQASTNVTNKSSSWTASEYSMTGTKVLRKYKHRNAFLVSVVLLLI